MNDQTAQTGYVAFPGGRIASCPAGVPARMPRPRPNSSRPPLPTEPSPLDGEH